MNLLVCPKTKNLSFDIKRGITSFLLGVEEFTTNQEASFTLDELKEIKKKYPDIEIFLLLNKNLENKEIKKIEKLLKEIDTLGLQGIFFYDQAILSIHNRLNLKTPLVWNQTHLVTNYNTCNYYYDKGCSYALVAGEITLREILEIKEKTKLGLMGTILGYPVMSHSKRRLLTNYFKFLDKDKLKKRYEIKEKERSFYVEEDDTGTSFYEGRLLNGTKVLFSLLEKDFPYVVVFEKGIDDEKLDFILPLYLKILTKKNWTKEEQEELITSSIEKLESDYTSFFYEETIYRVKDHG